MGLFGKSYSGKRKSSRAARVKRLKAKLAKKQRAEALRKEEERLRAALSKY